MTGIEAFADRYGLAIAVGLIVLFNWVLPFLRDKLGPAIIKRQDKELEDKEITIQSERQFHREMEKERNTDLRALRDVVEAIQRSLVQMNNDNTAIRDTERTVLTNQGTILDKQERYHSETVHEIRKYGDLSRDGMNEMREEVARRQGMEDGIKKHKKGDTGPLIEPEKGQPKE